MMVVDLLGTTRIMVEGYYALFAFGTTKRRNLVNRHISTLDVIPELVAALPVDQPVYVLGYHSVNDGGGGLFYWVENDTTSADDGHVFESGHASNPSGRWHRVLEMPWVNVKHFGARISDTIPSTEQFRKAIGAASRLSPAEYSSGGVAGGTVLVPEGNYVIGDLVVDRPITLTGVSGDGGAHGGTTLRVQSGLNSNDKPYHGIIVVSGSSQLVPNSFSDGATIANLQIRPQSIDPADNSAPTQPEASEWFPSDGGCGIFIESGAQITVRKVSVFFMKGHAMALSYGGTFAYHNRIDSCVLYGNHHDGVYISGGSDNSMTVCMSISSDANGGYDFRDKSYFGSTFISCQATYNQTGSFKQENSSTGCSVYVGCYWEPDVNVLYDGAPDMLSGLLVGGEASVYGRLGGFEERVGRDSARLGFKDEGYRGIYSAKMPDGLNEAVLKFRYQPNFPTGATSGPQGPFWSLRRRSSVPEFGLNGTAAEPTDTGYIAGSALLPRYERCWLIELENNPPFTSPFGWTDDLHPRGPGHFFVGKPVINQRCHWTLRHETTLQPGRNVVSIPVEDYWLLPESGAELALSFSIDVTGQSLSTVDFRVGAHAVTSTPTGANNAEVVLYNDGASAVTAHVVAHCEHAKRWYTSTNLG